MSFKNNSNCNVTFENYYESKSILNRICFPMDDEEIDYSNKNRKTINKPEQEFYSEEHTNGNNLKSSKLGIIGKNFSIFILEFLFCFLSIIS